MSKTVHPFSYVGNLGIVAGRVLLLFAMTAAMGGCRGGRPSAEPASAGLAPPALRADEIAALIPPRVRDRGGWAEAILNALTANNLNADRQPVCAVIAVIAQESGFAQDPVVPGLARLVATRIDRYKDRLGPLGEPLLKRLLEGRAPDDARSFEDRLVTVRTERDVDLLFRDLLAYYEVNHPA
ncbi:MAG: DUF1615 family protein, partial [Myxococcales bacterium]